MPYTTVVPSTTITAAWGNANIRDQVITPFASAAARTSAITSPVAGMVSYLSDVNGVDCYDGTAWRTPNILFARRTADTTISSNATLADDLYLFVSVAANAVYELRGFIVYTSGVAGDLKIGWSGPAGATFDWNVGGPGSNQDTSTGIPYNGTNTLAGVDTIGGINAGNLVARPSGLLVTAGTSGLLRFRWSQSVSDAFGTAVRTGSYLLLTRVG